MTWAHVDGSSAVQPHQCIAFARGLGSVVGPDAIADCSEQEQAESIVSFLSDEQLVKQLKQDKAHNLQFLQEQYAIGPPQIDALYHFAKFQFDCGNYSLAAEFLYHYRCYFCARSWFAGCALSLHKEKCGESLCLS